MLKILQVRLQLYMNWELPDFQVGFRKCREARDQIANICWVIEKAREFQKNIYFCFIDYVKTFDCVDHSKLESLPRDGNTRPPYLPPEKYVCRFKKQQLEPDMEQWTGSLGQDTSNCILSPCLLNLYAEYIMWNAGLDEAQAGIKIARRNTDNLRYADDTTLMAESDKELNNLLMKVREESQ